MTASLCVNGRRPGDTFLKNGESFNDPDSSEPIKLVRILNELVNVKNSTMLSTKLLLRMYQKRGIDRWMV